MANSANTFTSMYPIYKEKYVKPKKKLEFKKISTLWSK